ncbi:MAG: hypothetical protein ACK5UP_14610, partial [Bacteroidota bacterium]
MPQNGYAIWMGFFTFFETGYLTVTISLTSLFTVLIFVLPSRFCSYRALLILTMASVMLACNIDQKSVTSNFFHNTTAHYNGFYYAREKAREVEKAILKTLDDDPTQILRLFPGLDTVKAKA